MSVLKKYEKKNKMTNKEKALEKDYKIYCEMIGDLSYTELNRRYNKTYLLK